MRRRILLVLAGALVLMLLAWPAAVAKDLGTDVLGNISPAPQPGGSGALVDRYPLSAFSLDFHTDVGITELDGVPPTIAHWAAAQIWSLESFLLKTVIDLFTWAFSLDLLGGDPSRPDDGALAPVAKAISSLYENVIGEAWMVAAILAAGIWGIWKALVQRRYTETAAALTLSVVFVLIALFFVYQPERTVGEASRWTNTLSLAFLSGANRGTVDDPGQAKRHVADQLFDALVYRPWVVLEFGGLRHCVDTHHLDDDGYPRPVAPHDPARTVCRDHLRQAADGHGGYAQRFLRYPAGSDERNAEYNALRRGEKPEGRDAPFRGYAVDKTDSPAVDIQQEHGAYQRLTLAALFFVGALGAVVLLGFLSLAVILAQVVALVLLGFAPVALVIAIFPRAGHDFFRNWLGKLATAVFIKALYSLVIAIVVAVSAALASSTESLGFLFSFALQAIFFWAIFLYRRQITARLVTATTGHHYHERLPRMTAVQRAGDIATRPVSALIGSGRRGRGEHENRQQSALAGAPTPPNANAPAPAGELARHGHDTRSPDAAHANGDRPSDDSASDNGHAREPHRLARSLRKGREDPQRQRPAPDDALEADAPIRPEPRGQGRREKQPPPEPTPRGAHEDVMRRARELREQQRSTNDPEPEP
jgi:TrbL/VirB6 plasmid conjugal transfer protein